MSLKHNTHVLKMWWQRQQNQIGKRWEVQLYQKYWRVIGLLWSFPGIQVRRILRAAGSDRSRSMGGSGRSVRRKKWSYFGCQTQTLLTKMIYGQVCCPSIFIINDIRHNEHFIMNSDCSACIHSVYSFCNENIVCLKKWLKNIVV